MVTGPAGTVLNKLMCCLVLQYKLLCHVYTDDVPGSPIGNGLLDKLLANQQHQPD